MSELELRLIIFAYILSEFALIAIKVEVRSVEPPLPAPFAIAAEFVLMFIMFVVILSEFASIAIKVEVRSVELPPAPDAIAAEFVLILAAFDAIAIEFTKPRFVLAPVAIYKGPIQAILVEILLEFIMMLIIFAVVLSVFELMAMTTEVKSVEPPPPAPFAIAAEFVLTTAAFEEIFSEFLIMLILLRVPTSLLKLMLYILTLTAIMIDVRSVEPPVPFAIATEFMLMLIMFAVILSEFAPKVIRTEVRSVEPPPVPAAIAAEFCAMIIILSIILSAFALMLAILALIDIMFILVLIMFAVILSEFALMSMMLSLTIASILAISFIFELAFMSSALTLFSRSMISF